MNILEKFSAKQRDYQSARTPSIAFFGDSVTHGCFEIYMKNEKLETIVDTKNGYPEKIRGIFNILYPDVPVNIINAGISGDTAGNAQNRIERDVLSFNPDLVVVCFGLNDAMQGAEGITKYKNALCTIFQRIKKSGSDIILLTPNLTTDKAEIPFDDETLDGAVNSVIENEWLSSYLEEAKKEAHSQGIPVCDCNAIWEKLIENGVNVNNLLSNRVNHPTREMHWLFAYEIVKTIFNN
ncbi:MAG: GDSL family lipase [Clostridia bacterium]|nr:GDSL family lipase [Clostridia bacterium]